jgi:uncharacterized membrane protein
MFSLWQSLAVLFVAFAIAWGLVCCLAGIRIAERRQRLERERLAQEKMRIKFAAVVEAAQAVKPKPKPLRHHHKPDPPEAA